ncbi:MAG: SPOR domain-containing protein [Deltaproteobacteria bacterium]|nr:SPOR domain-containing protein [Deltaproteobacteria bacterium]
MPLWYVQVGAFSEKPNAESLRDLLVNAGFPTLVTSSERDNRVLYITRVGPYPSRVKAEIGAERLRKEGHQAVILQLKP